MVDRGSGPVWPRSMDRRTRNMDRRTGPQKLLSCFMCKTDSAVHGTRPVVHSAVRPAVHPMVHYQWICTYSDPHLHPTTSLCYGNDITPLYVPCALDVLRTILSHPCITICVFLYVYVCTHSPASSQQCSSRCSQGGSSGDRSASRP